MQTEKFIQKARQKVAEAIQLEHDFCVELTKSRKHGPSARFWDLQDNSRKSFEVARRAVKALYKKTGLQTPKMPTIYMAEIALNDLEKKLNTLCKPFGEL